MDARISFFDAPKVEQAEIKPPPRPAKKKKLRKKKKQALKKPEKIPVIPIQAPKKGVDFGKVARFVKQEDGQAKIIRHPGVYSNGSPYGIATEMLMAQMQEEASIRKGKEEK